MKQIVEKITHVEHDLTRKRGIRARGDGKEFVYLLFCQFWMTSRSLRIDVVVCFLGGGGEGVGGVYSISFMAVVV